MSRPLFAFVIRREMMAEFCRAGERPLEAIRHARLATNELIDEAIREASATTGISVPNLDSETTTVVGAPFDGHLIREFEAWLQTPQGQMFWQIIKAILTALIPLIL